MLWKKELTGESFIDLFEQIPNNGSDIVELTRKLIDLTNQNRAQKDNELSIDFRKKGNEKYHNKNWLEAMELYNRSLCLAEIGTENVSIAYGNRSACFFELKLYAKCIADIELAKKAKYPDHLMPKLLSRHEECLKLMENMDQPKILVPKLSFRADKKFPGMANVLKIEYNEEFGRQITAKCDLEVGKTILIDETYLQVMSKMEQRCVLCSKKAMNFIPCGHCTSALFCSNECGVNFHQKECGLGNRYYGDGMQLTVRSIFIALSIFNSIEKLMEFVEDAIGANKQEVPSMFSDMKSKYRAFLKLHVVEYSDNTNFLRTARELYQTITSRTSLLSVFETQQKQRFLMHLIYHHYRAIQSNFFKYHHTDMSSQFVLFIMQSYFNHSCFSNVVFAVHGNTTVCKTARPIKAGDQLFLTYSDSIVTKSKSYRQKRLYETYGFLCECEKCEPVSYRSKDSSILKDPNYKYILKKVDADSYNSDKKRRDTIKKICIKILNKFGSRYSEEVEHITYLFRAICSTEEIEINSMLSH